MITLSVQSIIYNVKIISLKTRLILIFGTKINDHIRNLKKKTSFGCYVVASNELAYVVTKDSLLVANKCSTAL